MSVKHPSSNVGQNKAVAVGVRRTRREFLRDLAASAVILPVSGAIFAKNSSNGSGRWSQENSIQGGLSLATVCEPSPGTILDEMDSIGTWQASTGNGANSASLTSTSGYNGGQAIRLNYDLGATEGAWVQLKRDFDPPLDLSGYDHLRFFYQGTAMNTLEVGLVSGGQNYFASPWKEVTHVPWWTYSTWDLQGFRKDGQPVSDFSQITAIFISVVKGADSVGGAGSFTVDKIQGLTAKTRTTPSSSDTISTDPAVKQKAASWIAAQQKPGGLLKSWQEDTENNAWLYDQALALIVLAQTDPARAGQLAAKLIDLQEPDGFWYAGYDYSTGQPLSQTSKPVGAVAWVVYALSYYASTCGAASNAQTAASKGASWLAGLQRPEGSLPGEQIEPPDNGAPTESNLDTWWAFRVTGRQAEADALKNFLLNSVWDSAMGRFKSSGQAYPDRYGIYLDNQTWGAAFLRAVNREEDARRALNYAYWMLLTDSGDGTYCGFDGAGPFSVWNEGTLQYIAQRGENCQGYWNQMVGQQAADGGLPGSSDNFSSGLVWLTKMHGIAPTAWLYFAATGGPFAELVPKTCVYLPAIAKE